MGRFRRALQEVIGHSEQDEGYDIGRQLRNGGVAVVALGIAGMAVDAAIGADETFVVSFMVMEAGAAMTLVGKMIEGAGQEQS